jgi:hypothetical protein
MVFPSKYTLQTVGFDGTYLFDSPIYFQPQPLLSPLPQRQPNQELVREIEISGCAPSALTCLPQLPELHRLFQMCRCQG